MEVERDSPDAPLGARDRLVLETMQNVYRELQRRPNWLPGFGVAQIRGGRDHLLKDWNLLVDSVQDEVVLATIFNEQIEPSDWPDVPACLLLGLQAFLTGKVPSEVPPRPLVETWKLVCSFLALGLIEERQKVMSGYLEGFIKRHKAANRIGPAFDPKHFIRPEGA